MEIVDFLPLSFRSTLLFRLFVLFKMPNSFLSQVCCSFCPVVHFPRLFDGWFLILCTNSPCLFHGSNLFTSFVSMRAGHLGSQQIFIK